MPAARRRTAPSEAPPSTQQAREAAINAPRRRKRAQTGGIEAFLTTWELAPLHLQDNKFILRGYRAGHDFKAAIKSALRIHNETGNIWTHLIGMFVSGSSMSSAISSWNVLASYLYYFLSPIPTGFFIFLFLTVTTIYLRPEPLRLGSETLKTVEHRLRDLGAKTNLYDLLATAEAWERTVLRLGADGLEAVEDALRSIGNHNVGELVALRDALADSVGSSARDVGRRLRQYKDSGIAELAHVESKLSSFSAEAVRDLEAGINRALAAVIGTRWPVSRWPMHIFTAGAMICLLTSAVCHIFGCCAAHISSVMWRFDYAGIAVLIVASFYPPVYYGFMCRPILSFVYLLATTILGASTLCITLLERFQDPKWHEYRAGLFVALGLFGVIPLVHGWHLHGGVADFVGAVRLDIIMGVIYIVSKIPPV